MSFLRNKAGIEVPGLGKRTVAIPWQEARLLRGLGFFGPPLDAGEYVCASACPLLQSTSTASGSFSAMLLFLHAAECNSGSINVRFMYFFFFFVTSAALHSNLNAVTEMEALNSKFLTFRKAVNRSKTNKAICRGGKNHVWFVLKKLVFCKLALQSYLKQLCCRRSVLGFK